MVSSARASQPGMPLVTDLPARDVMPYESALRGFMARGAAYRTQFTQEHYEFGFDGYSYQGQQDSTHQGPEDLLHTFVFSDFHPVALYPSEFRPLLGESWTQLTGAVRSLEQDFLSGSCEHLQLQYPGSFGHMLSANYYPPQTEVRREQTRYRLSEHPDVSLMTVFPFGIDSQFEFQCASGDWLKHPAVDRVVIFPGYLLEWLTRGQVPALNHRVRLAGEQTQDRTSFALFSLPGPGSILQRPGAHADDPAEEISVAEYFQLYLSLWDY